MIEWYGLPNTNINEGDLDDSSLSEWNGLGKINLRILCVKLGEENKQTVVLEPIQITNFDTELFFFNIIALDDKIQFFKVLEINNEKEDQKSHTYLVKLSTYDLKNRML